MIDTRRIRDRAAKDISYHTAQAAGWSYSELTQFVCGSYHPDDKALLDLAAVLNMQSRDLYR